MLTLESNKKINKLSVGGKLCDLLKIVNAIFVAPRHPSARSYVNEYLTTDSGGNVGDLVLAHNCCLARMLSGEAELVSE